MRSNQESVTITLHFSQSPRLVDLRLSGCGLFILRLFMPKAKKLLALERITGSTTTFTATDGFEYYPLVLMQREINSPWDH
jgi:hypothetical protein